MDKLELVIFDMDGTLIDSGTAISNAINYVRAYHGLELMEKDKLLEAMNDPHVDSPTYFYNTPEFTEKQTELFHEYYDKNCIHEMELYDGIFQLVEELHKKNITMCVATNANSKNAIAMLKTTKLFTFLDLIVGADMVQKPKPSADMVTYILEKTDIKSNNALVVGDSLKDKYAAKNADVKSILVDWGFSNHDENDVVKDIDILKNNILDLI